MVEHKQPRERAASCPSALPRGWGLWVLIGLGITAGALLHVRSQLGVMHLGYALSQAASEHRELLEQRRRLQIEMATLRSPRRLRRLAVERFGLVEPRGEQIVRLQGRSGVRPVSPEAEDNTAGVAVSAARQ